MKTVKLSEQSNEDVKGRLYELEVAEKNINIHLELYDQEKASLTESDREKETRKSALEEQLSEASGQLKELEEEMERLTKQKQTLSSTKETLSHELTECKVVCREKEQACSSEEDNLKRLKKSLKKRDSL